MATIVKYECLLEENRLLKGKLWQVENELEVWRKGNTFTTKRGRVPVSMTLRSPSPDKERFPRQVSRKRNMNCLDNMVARALLFVRGQGGWFLRVN